MKSQVTEKPDSSDLHLKRIQSVAGTMAIDGIILSEISKQNLDRYAQGQADYQQIMAELKAKYKKSK